MKPGHHNRDLRYPDITAHKLIAKTAVELAYEIYDQFCRYDNTFYANNKDMDDFIRRWAPELRKAARVALVRLLDSPTTSVAEKDEIWEALVLDAQLPEGGTSITERIN